MTHLFFSSSTLSLIPLQKNDIFNNAILYLAKNKTNPYIFTKICNKLEIYSYYIILY